MPIHSSDMTSNETAYILRNFEENYLNISNSSGFGDFPESIFDFPISDVYKVVLEKSQGSYLGTVAQVILIIVYAMLIALGLIGNFLVAFVIGRKSQLRTTKNLYIINLTISDVSMCLVCMPFTLVALLQKNWTLGSVICKLIPALQCTNILVSTATIVAIATDRYMTIVQGNRGFGARTNVLCSVILIWVASLGFTCPLFIFYHVKRVTLREIFLYNRCLDNWNPPIVKALWTLCLLLIQYVIPILVLGFVHVRIKHFLTQNQASQRDPRRMQREMERNRRTTTLLTSVAGAFAVSWLPWHVVNFLADFHYSGFKDPAFFYGVFGGCHAVAMSTACSNPILYGWLNTNLKTELSAVISWTCSKIRCRSCSRARCPSQTRLEPRTPRIAVPVANQKEEEPFMTTVGTGKKSSADEDLATKPSPVSGNMALLKVAGTNLIKGHENSATGDKESDSFDLLSMKKSREVERSEGQGQIPEWSTVSRATEESGLLCTFGTPNEMKTTAVPLSGTHDPIINGKMADTAISIPTNALDSCVVNNIKSKDIFTE